MRISTYKYVFYILLFLIWIIIRVYLFYKNSKKLNIKREITINIFFAYFLWMLEATLFPLRIDLHASKNLISVNFVPVLETAKDVFNTINNKTITSFSFRFWIKNLFGNLLVLTPICCMLPMLWRKFNSLWKVVLFGFLLSLSIEFMQYLSGYIGNIGRAFDVDDILLNTLGTFIGFLIFKKIKTTCYSD